MKKTYLLACLSLTAGLLASTHSFACASCGCTLKSDWEGSGVEMSNGFKFDVRYDYLDQNQLRHNTHTITETAASQLSNKNGEPYEIEKYTQNHYITLSGDYSDPSGFGVNLALPYIIRKHETLGVGSDGFTPVDGGGQYRSSTSGIGDLKVLGRFAGFKDSNIGLLLGVKLPTGDHKEKGTSTDPTAPGPVAIDRGLQPGTGTTDGIVGLYYGDRPIKELAYFATAMYQYAFNSSDKYRPGDNYTVSTGIRYMANPLFTPQLQINYRGNKHDTGANADTISTAGQIVYVSPGVSLHVNDKTSLYSFVQLPVYQHLAGVQIAPKYVASIGLHFGF